MDRTRRQRDAYEFLQSRVGETFGLEELAQAADWKPGAASTYISKYLKGLVERLAPRLYRVLPEFRRLSFDEYHSLADQTRRVFQAYDRDEYESVVTFQFLLPLTREEQLRQALDDLFYADTVGRLLREAGLERFEQWVPRAVGTPDDHYADALTAEAGKRFGGYSVSHVSGRFRASDRLLTRGEAAQRFLGEQRYLIDETTAIALFIVPLGESKFRQTQAEQQIEMFTHPEPSLHLEIAEELDLVRDLFFCLFVEALVRYVPGEDQIWLIEDGPGGRRLHVWSAR